MTDYDASSIPRPSTPKRSLARSSLPRSSSSYGSYEAGESSTLANLTHDTSTDNVNSSSLHKSKEEGSGLRSAKQQEHDSKYDTYRRRPSNKPRPASSFLLSNNFLGEPSKPLPKRQQGDDQKKSRIPVDSRRAKSSLGSYEDSNSLGSSESLGAPDGSNGTRSHSAQTQNSVERGDVGDERSRSQAAHRQGSRIPSYRPGSAPFDIDSNQIVSMALDLSESRRLASRRNISSPIPSNLTQLSDGTPGRGISLHLQQQRRNLRNISPMADAKLSSRVLQSPRTNIPMQAPFDHDGSFPHRFSSSTLHRAQKAKEYLELMAQYRRILVFLAPLKQDARSRPSTANLITSGNPTEATLKSLASSQNRMGRAYNPLQYIRNRKIRTRERKTIDGEAQGFGDVPRVTDWIDEVAAHTAASSPVTESATLPSFAPADESMKQQLLTSNLPRLVSNKSKRLRFEWSFDPADMLADIYWLEQGDNKYLIEDRHYAKIYPSKPAALQPTTQTNDLKPGLVSSIPKDIHDGDGVGSSDNGIAHSIKTDVESTLASTRDRARQKLQDLRGLHHKHSSTGHAHHDFLRFRRGSSSDSSDNDSDRRRRGRSGTLSASGKDLLEKQMNDMLARETLDELNQPAQDEPDKAQPATVSMPSQNSEVVLPQHSRKNSRAETLDNLDKSASDRPSQPPSLPSGRVSLEVPTHFGRSSFEFDTSRLGSSDPASKSHRHSFIQAIGMDISPHPSRPSSPTRNPFLKVKNMFRDHDERESEEKMVNSVDPVTVTAISAATKELLQNAERSRSKSSTREIMKMAHENSKSHRGLHMRPEDQVGLRTIFKGGAKLDDMIRGGVSKVTDLIWKKDSDSSSEAGDDSDADDVRGRRRDSAPLASDPTSGQLRGQRSVKNYLDIMPSFKPTTEADKATSNEIDGFSKSQRSEPLKRSRSEVKMSSALLGFENSNSRNFMDSELSENDSRSRELSYAGTKSRPGSKEFQGITFTNRNELPASFTDKAWAVSDRGSLTQNGLLSRREVARLRALMLCSGIKAMELARRANESHPLLGSDDRGPKELANLSVPQSQFFPRKARMLTDDVTCSIQMIETSATLFSTETAPALRQRVDAVHTRIAMDFMDMTRRAADEADDVSHDVLDSQRLKIKSVVEAMDKMLRRRRRRFRYVRRAGWLAVEWVLVGFMWYVWFIVMIARIFLGAGRGVLSVVRWLLWL